MSVRENLAFGLANVGTPKAEIATRVATAARMLEMDHLLERKPAQLSGGQRQRVAIGRAIVREPKVFLFDEPLSNLDAGLRTRTRFELSQLHDRLGATMIFVTHDQIEAMTLATRIVLLNKGRIEQVGAPMDIYARPSTRYVAQFVGSPPMNFLPVARIEAARTAQLLQPPTAQGCKRRFGSTVCRQSTSRLVYGPESDRLAHGTLRAKSSPWSRWATALVHAELADGTAGYRRYRPITTARGGLKLRLPPRERRRCYLMKWGKGITRPARPQRRELRPPSEGVRQED